MGKHVSESTFDPRSLKDPNQKIAVFIIYTLDKMETYAASIAMTLTYLFDTLAADERLGQVTAVIDECGALNMPKLADSLNFYRKAGLRCLMIWQDLAGQTEKTYGKATMKQIMAGSKLKIGMGLQEPETLEMFSKLCGTQTATGMTLNDRSVASDALPTLNDGLNHHSVPLMRPEQIRTMSSDEILIVAGNLPAMKLQKVRYWQRPGWLKIAGPSPFHRE
jgi:type IV secretory pathway TraG/TraD family ATPase VirD4